MLNKLKSAYLWTVVKFATFFAKVSLKLVQHSLKLEGVDYSKFELLNKPEIYNKDLLDMFESELGKDEPAYEPGFDPKEFLKKKFDLTDIEVVELTDLSNSDDRGVGAWELDNKVYPSKAAALKAIK